MKLLYIMHCSKGPAGDFRIKKETAERMGLTVSKSNDQRFDVDDSSWAAAKYLKTLDSYFSEETVLIGTLKTIPISDSVERRKFAIAAYNLFIDGLCNLFIIVYLQIKYGNLDEELRRTLVSANIKYFFDKKIGDLCILKFFKTTGYRNMIINNIDQPIFLL